MTYRTYRATYGGRACQAITTDGRWFTVLLDTDPGFGSMIFSRIYVTEVVLGREIANGRGAQVVAEDAAR